MCVYTEEIGPYNQLSCYPFTLVICKYFDRALIIEAFAETINPTQLEKIRKFYKEVPGDDGNV